MKKIITFLFLALSIIAFSQEKTYRFLYDFHQETILDKAENPNMPSEDYNIIVAELNKSYEVEVTVNSSFSFVKLVEKINNDQNKSFIKIEPEPKWLLNDFETNNSYDYIDTSAIYLIDSIQSISMKPTRNSKKILGFDTKEFIAEDKTFSYHFWLMKQGNLSVSPLKLQFKGYIVVEAEIINKKENNSKTTTERKVTYRLKNMTEENSFDFKKLKPKKVMTQVELDALLEKVNTERNSGVEKD